MRGSQLPYNDQGFGRESEDKLTRIGEGQRKERGKIANLSP